MVTDAAGAARDAGQTAFTYRFDWGLDGLRAVGPAADFVVIVDVLRFTSAVSAAVESDVTVLPYPWDRADAEQFAARHDAVLAGRREHNSPSLSPTDMLALPGGKRLVLPSPNGAALSIAARDLAGPRVLAGCLRNAAATATFARRGLRNGGAVAVIAAGERWADGSLRPAVEDLLGAGAILAALDPSGAVSRPCCSPEARAARAAFVDARPRLFDHLCRSASGVELLRRGWEDDIATSAALDVTDRVAELVGNEFVVAR